MDFLFKKVMKLLKLEDKDSCKCPKSNPDYCDHFEPLLYYSKKYKEVDITKVKMLYEEVTRQINDESHENSENSKQIQKDLDRTFPGICFFQTPECHRKMFNVLKAFSIFNKEISYVQGMNFIVGFLIYHAEEYIAFWLFITLIEDYELKNIFSDGLPGLINHSNMIKSLLKHILPDIHQRFEALEVEVEIIIAEWVFSLFSAVIPLKLQIEFYKSFFNEGWKFFYKLCIAIITSVQGDLYNLDEPGDIYICLKLIRNDFDQDDEDILEMWKKLLKNSLNIKIDSIQL